MNVDYYLSAYLYWTIIAINTFLFSLEYIKSTCKTSLEQAFRNGEL